MKKKKYSIFTKGDVIRTNPEKGFYGVAIVLDDGKKIDYFYPMCHIAVTPLLFQHEITMEDIDISQLKPMTFIRNYSSIDGKIRIEGYRKEFVIHVYTTRNVAGLPVIGKVEPEIVYDEPLLWEPQADRFFWCGNVDEYLGREAYISWCRENNIEI